MGLSHVFCMEINKRDINKWEPSVIGQSSSEVDIIARVLKVEKTLCLSSYKVGVIAAANHDSVCLN